MTIYYYTNYIKFRTELIRSERISNLFEFRINVVEYRTDKIIVIGIEKKSNDKTKLMGLKTRVASVARFSSLFSRALQMSVKF